MFLATTRLWVPVPSTAILNPGMRAVTDCSLWRIRNRPFGVPTFVSSVSTITTTDPALDLSVRFSPSRPVMSPLTLTCEPFEAPYANPLKTRHSNAVQSAVPFRCFIKIPFRWYHPELRGPITLRLADEVDSRDSKKRYFPRILAELTAWVRVARV